MAVSCLAREVTCSSLEPSLGPWGGGCSFSPFYILPKLRLCTCPGEYRGPPSTLEMKSKDAPKQKTYLYCIPIYRHFQAMTVHTFDGPKSVRHSLASVALARASSMPALSRIVPPCSPTAVQASAHSIKTRYRGSAFSVQAMNPGVM